MTYKETYWKYKTGFKTRNFNLTINTIDPSKNREEKQTSVAKISLVAFLREEQKKSLVTTCRLFKSNNPDFYQNSNLHVTLFGFAPLERKHNQKIQERIREFFKRKSDKAVTIKLDTIRPGIIYSENQVDGPVQGLSNGTVIAIGNVEKNIEFFINANQLTSFLLVDNYISSILGSKFRRKFPTVWCTLGYYNRNDKFKITSQLENIFKQYDNIASNALNFSISELKLVKSNYKDLRYCNVIEKFSW